MIRRAKVARHHRLAVAGDATTKEIRRRGELLRAAAEETRAEHRGSGAANGRCPIVTRNISKRSPKM